MEPTDWRPMKLSFTKLTLVNLLASPNPHVFFQIYIQFEYFVTDFALMMWQLIVCLICNIVWCYVRRGSWDVPIFRHHYTLCFSCCGCWIWFDKFSTELVKFFCKCLLINKACAMKETMVMEWKACPFGAISWIKSHDSSVIRHNWPRPYLLLLLRRRVATYLGGPCYSYPW